MINRTTITLLVAAASISLAGCHESTKATQADKAEQAANSISFSENAEIDNIKARLELTSKPAQIGYIVLLNQMGEPIKYDTVRGKVTSGSKRLTRPYYVTSGGSVTAPSDEGTWGSSNEYIFYWTTAGQYVQWSSTYLYSDQPIRLTKPTLVVESK